jgi:hypothetical protein
MTQERRRTRTVIEQYEDVLADRGDPPVGAVASSTVDDSAAVSAEGRRSSTRLYQMLGRLW